MSAHDLENPGRPDNEKPSWEREDPSLKPKVHLHPGAGAESLKAGYELADANVKGIVAFLVALLCLIAVVWVVVFGMGKLINTGIMRQDGPASKWNRVAGVKPATLVSDPRIEQQQLQMIVGKFPTPRLQTDDGNMDVAEMHAREDILLDYYTWVGDQHQAVRIPIDRAMQLIAQQGLPVEAQQAQQQQAMFGDGSKAVTAPLTDGFARTGPELEMIATRNQRMEQIKPETQAKGPERAKGSEQARLQTQR